MRAGVSHISHAASAVWAPVAGAWSADYPLANLSSLKSIRSPAVNAEAAASAFRFVLPAAVPMDFFALVHHNAPAGATLRIRTSAGTDPLAATNHDSGVTSFWPSGAPAAAYLATRPYLLPAPVMVRSGRIDLNVGLWEIGAVEMGSFWAWPDVGVDRGIGIESRSEVETMAGADFATRLWSPRIVTGSRNVIDQAEADTTLLDFQRAKGFSEPFVWVWDIDDPATWLRQSMLVRNAELPPGQSLDYEAAKMAFSFVEHLG